MHELFDVGRLVAHGGTGAFVCAVIGAGLGYFNTEKGPERFDHAIWGALWGVIVGALLGIFVLSPLD